MRRLYCPEEKITDGCLEIGNPQKIAYLRNVLRLRRSDCLMAFDGKGIRYHCQIKELSKKRARLFIKKREKDVFLRRDYLAIACALTKQKNKFDDLVDQLTQLGVDKILPMATQRVIARWNDCKRQKHLERWQRIAANASAQSGRSVLPQIEPLSQFSRILAVSESYDLKLIPTLGRARQGLSEMTFALARRILVLIGPEGDFSEAEITQAEAAGFIPVSLGSLVLRVNTAALAVAAFFRLSRDIPRVGTP